MNRLAGISLIVFFLAACGENPAPVEPTETISQETSPVMAVDTRPNIVFIMADDLGYSDIAPFGGEIKTPNLTALANSGIRLTNMHAAPTCSPSRGMFLSGTDTHLAGFGSMRGMQTPEQKGQPGYEAELSHNVVTFAAMLKDAGYHTYMAGKWDQGYGPGNYPPDRGFERSFALRVGGSHFSDRRGINPASPFATYLEDGEPVGELPDDFYSSHYYTDKLIEYIEQNRASEEPFFAWLAYTAPHWPLQVEEEYLDSYRGQYDAGYEAIRRQRLTRMQSMGLVADDIEVAPQHLVWSAWDDLSADGKKTEARAMEIYAAMIEVMDRDIGRLFEYLRRTGEYENTLIVFMSDNGAEGATALDLGNREWIPANFDQSYENMGRRNSYTEYGPGWAWTSSTPFRLYKGFTYEGGLRSPTIISYGDHIEGGVVSSRFATIMDYAPTFLELAGVEGHDSEYNGRTVNPMRGESMLPFLFGDEDTIHDPDYYVGWEIFNRRAVHQGDWKIAWINTPWGSYEWALYNLEDDPAEQYDLSGELPEKLAGMLELWDDYVEQNGVITADRLNIPWSNSTDWYDGKLKPDG